MQLFEIVKNSRIVPIHLEKVFASFSSLILFPAMRKSLIILSTIWLTLKKLSSTLCPLFFSRSPSNFCDEFDYLVKDFRTIADLSDREPDEENLKRLVSALEKLQEQLKLFFSRNRLR